MIELKHITKKFQQTQQTFLALDNVSLKIEKGDFFGIVGASGSGKSTLLRLINLLESPSEGKILIEGKDILALSDKQQRSLVQNTGFIFQHFNLLQNLTVFQNAGLPLKIQGKTNPTAVKDMIEFVGMTDYLSYYPSQLSGGQKQRIAIARALVTSPTILLCDEPTSALDEYNSNEIMKLLKKIQEHFDTTIVFVSHELPLIKNWCNRAGILEAGRLLDVIKVSPADEETNNQTYYEQALEYLR